MDEKRPKPRIEHEGDLEADDVGMGLPGSYYRLTEGPRGRTPGDRPKPHAMVSAEAEVTQERISARLDDIERALDVICTHIGTHGEDLKMIARSLEAIDRRTRADGSDQKPLPESE